MPAATRCCAASAKATRGTSPSGRRSEKVEQQAKKVKGKWTERKRSDTPRRTARAGGDGTGRGARAEAAERETVAPRVIRATRYAVKPMSVEDAALRMEETRRSVHRLSQPRVGVGQHRLPAQRRQSRADRAGLRSGSRDLPIVASFMTAPTRPAGVTVAMVLDELARRLSGPVSTSSSSPANRASDVASPSRIRRRPDWRCRASTPRSKAGVS